MTLGFVDLSIVTLRLIDRLKTWTTASRIKPDEAIPPYTIDYSGLAPDAARKSTDGASCQVSVYLFHVAADKFHRNTFPTGGSAQRIPEQPLALTLYYLLTAYSKSVLPTSYIEEQQAMSIALKCFHENPIVTVLVPIEGRAGREEEFTLTIEPQTVDEIGRLWQSISSPMRLSAVYRVSVIFIEAPPEKTPEVVRHAPDFKPPHEVEPFPIVPGPITETDRTGFVAITIDQAGFAAGKTTVQLRALPLVETLLTTAPPTNRHFHVVHVEDVATLSLRVPLFTPSGRYLLTVRPAADKPALEIWLTVPEPIVIVAVDATGFATIVIDDAGFAVGATEVQIGTASLAESMTEPLAAGQFRVVDDTLHVQVPAATTTGRHPITVRPAAGQPALAFWLEVP